MTANEQNVMYLRVGSAVFYGLSSFMITVVNKIVLTSFDFPSSQVLGIGQMLATILVLLIAKKLRYIDFPNLEISTFTKIWPLPLIFIGNMIFGLAVRRLSTKCFKDDYSQHYVPLSGIQRMALTLGAAAISLTNPYRGDMIACLGETTGLSALEHCLKKMQSKPEGQRILSEQPRINTSTVDMSALKALPKGTLGRIYYDFLEDNKVSPDSRPPVKFVDDFELAYVMQRYRETHDIFHAALLMPTTMLGEVTVKWVEALQTHLPMCVGGAIFGAVRLRPKQRKMYLDYYLPWAIETGRSAEFLLGIYFEERWEQTLEDFYHEMNISPLVKFKE
ncbi:ubiquinone biosynthesis protein COQ4 homolog, mitochondrial-like [Prorops nasuta]|uniref:ubiquinone biosynthesis protein COQ4 homolog, mitochondrial-like n=1 Tax=Prorops nasuta TaxID=863751 RepID=UPI0034CD354E